MVQVNDDSAFLSIGDLARPTGLPVKTIRYYADIGLVPPTDRSPAATAATTPSRRPGWISSVRFASSASTSRPSGRSSTGR